MIFVFAIFVSIIERTGFSTKGLASLLIEDEILNLCLIILMLFAG
jgi:hypothetical protein